VWGNGVLREDGERHWIISREKVVGCPYSIDKTKSILVSTNFFNEKSFIEVFFCCHRGLVW
jgi:hypothetical protein